MELPYPVKVHQPLPISFGAVLQQVADEKKPKPKKKSPKPKVNKPA